MALSNMAKALDPERDPSDAELKFWRDMFGILDRLLKLNLILCPSSRLHEKESYVHSLRRDIEVIYDHLSNGVSFQYPEEIHLLQLVHALDRQLKGEPVSFDAVGRREVLVGDVDEWVPPIRVVANIPSFFDPPSHTQAVRDRAHAALTSIWQRWRDDLRPFADRFADELKAGADVLVEQYAAHLRAQYAYLRGDPGVLEEVANPPLLASLVPRLCRYVAEREQDPSKALDVVLDFLRTEQAARAPYNWNSALLMAALARKAGAGQKRVGKGTLNDVIALSSVAPYCDAIFMDDEMAGLLREGPLDAEFVTAARHFSNHTREAFLEYLRGIETSANPEHLDLVRQLYRETRLMPFYEIIEAHRQRRARAEPT